MPPRRYLPRHLSSSLPSFTYRLIAQSYSALCHPDWALQVYAHACALAPFASAWLGVAACWIALEEFEAAWPLKRLRLWILRMPVCGVLISLVASKGGRQLLYPKIRYLFIVSSPCFQCAVPLGREDSGLLTDMVRQLAPLESGRAAENLKRVAAAPHGDLMMSMPLDRIERGIRRSQGASGTARVDQTASVASTSQGVPNSPPPPVQRTRDDPSSLSPLATTFHLSASQEVSAVASALVGITRRGSSKKSEPSLAGDLSSSTSAAQSVKSGDSSLSSHYRTPITTSITNITPPIPSVVGPPAGLNQGRGFDPDNSELAAAISQSIAQSTESITQIVTQNVTQALTAYLDKRLQAQEFAVQASQAALEKKLLEKVERIEDDQAFLRGEVQAQKKSISELRVSTDKVASEVTKLAEQVKAQHKLKVDVSDHVTPKDLDQVWNQLNALQNAVFPEVSPSPPSVADPQESLSFEPPRENPLQPTAWIDNSAFQPESPSPSPAFHSALSGSPPSSSSGYQSSITFDPIPSLRQGVLLLLQDQLYLPSTA
ncbi:hypothetical protein CEUSTIGMA_g7005.t1 [Chlamydomonas eustigma]|uniref:Uncharacterized protein n=1 Tax=Chlamydomonas eustigma TaxID=1157962 RepID=A0A250X910_9CHLO|nr:hypothetical protein CEUSTIGMA_g7005.t1 [Chlamydomonas eustigma]|eukprot:GAX79564.1 hypothetical protein CEUSTIGMA_g7005.t1 [Chlamydomonas eustigma]